MAVSRVDFCFDDEELGEGKVLAAGFRAPSKSGRVHCPLVKERVDLCKFGFSISLDRRGTGHMWQRQILFRCSILIISSASQPSLICQIFRLLPFLTQILYLPFKTI